MAENTGSGEEEKGTKRSIYTALATNFLITVSKLIARFATKSAALLAEGAHSVADTVNQIFLLISLPLSKANPDRDHPYDHGKTVSSGRCSSPSASSSPVRSSRSTRESPR